MDGVIILKSPTIVLIFFFSSFNEAWSKGLDILGTNNILKVDTIHHDDPQKSLVRFQYCEYVPTMQCRYLGNVGWQNYFYSREKILEQKVYEKAELAGTSTVYVLAGAAIAFVSAWGGAGIAMAVTELELGGVYMGVNYTAGVIAGGSFAYGALEGGAYGFIWLKDQFRGLNAVAQYNDVLALSSKIIDDVDFSESDTVVLEMAKSLNIVLNKIEN